MNQVLLVYPIPTKESPQKTPPLSIMYVGAYCERRGYHVEYFDDRWDTDFADKLGRADVVGVSSMSGYQLYGAVHYLKLAKEAGKTTVIGGIHGTIAPETIMSTGYADFIVTGEGEVTFYDLLAHIDGGYDNYSDIPGIVWVNESGEWTTNGPRLKMLTEEIESPISPSTIRYFKLSNETDDVMLPASRGCPFACGFCINSTKTAQDRRWRAVPTSKWAADLDLLIANGIDIKFMQVGDDWLGSESRIIQIGRLLYSRGIKWSLSIRANQINCQLVSYLKDYGCVGVSIGAESGSDDVLNLINKGITTKDTVNAAVLLSNSGIKPLYYFIVGFPTETEEQQLTTMALADELHRIHNGKCSIAFFGFYPQKGTNLGEMAQTYGMKCPETLEEWCSHQKCNTPNKRLNAIYHIAGLTFHRTKGDKTDKNFPGILRVVIWPFEILCVIRWRLRLFSGFGLEAKIINYLIRRFGTASRRLV